MDLVIFVLTAFAGGLVSFIFFGGARSGPFEEAIMKGLRGGKRVVVSIDDDCYIFEMYGNRMRITRGMATFSEEPYGLASDNLVNLDTHKPSDDTEVSG